MRYLGVDLHSNNFTVCFLGEGGVYTFEKYPLKELEAFKVILRPDDYIAVEATGNSLSASSSTRVSSRSSSSR